MYLSMRGESDLLFSPLSSRRQWLCFCAGQNVGSYWHNSATMTVHLQESCMDVTWGSAECAALISERVHFSELRYLLMEVQGDFHHVNFAIGSPELSPEFSPAGTCRQGHRSEYRPGGGCTCSSVPQGMSGRSVESHRLSQEGACKKPSSSHISQKGHSIGLWNFRSI